MAKEKKEKTKKKKSSTLVVILLMLASLAMIVFFQMTFVFFLVGMLPSIVVLFIDNTESKHQFHTIFACNFSGVLPFVMQLIAGHNQTSEMYYMIKDVQVLFIMWFSAGMGYALFAIAPKIAQMLIMSVNERRMHHFKHIQENLLQEWGTGIAYIDEEDALRHSNAQSDA